MEHLLCWDRPPGWFAGHRPKFQLMRSVLSLLVVAAALAPLFHLATPAQQPSGEQILRLDPALDRLIAPGSALETVSSGYQFTEGPMWRGNRLWFSDEEGGKIYAISRGQASPMHVPSALTQVLVDFTHPPYGRPDGQQTGPNAMATARDGSVVIAEQYARAIVHLQGTGTPTDPVHAVPFFDSYRGKHLNSPNDLVFLPDGSFFFTDPPYGLKRGDRDPAKELPFNAVFYYKDGQLTPVITDLTLPNGIALSPDNHILYVNNSGPAQRVIAYPLHPDGTIGQAHDVITFTGHEGHGVPDGLKTDSEGNIWTTGPGGIRVITPQGKILGQFKLPETAANLAWGGPDGRTLYITATSHIYRLQTLIKGNLPAFQR